MYKVFDDVVDLQKTKEFYGKITVNNFPWFFSSCVDPGCEMNRTVDKPYFIDQSRFNVHQKVISHMAWFDGKKNSALADDVENYINDFCSKVGITYEQIIRAQFNMVFTHPSSLPSCPHVDQIGDHGVLLFYMHDTDGDTFILDDYANEIARVSPKEGRVLAFDGDTLHSGGCPVDHEIRVVLNVNLYKMRWNDEKRSA